MSTTEDPRALLAGLATGEVAARDMAQLSAADIATILQLAGNQSAAGRHEDAARLFAFLVALEPDQPDHLLRLADAQVQAGTEPAAVESLTRYLDGARDRTDEGRAWAHVVRADLLEAADATLAARDRRAAALLAQTSDAARAIVEGAH